ncbi:hypothetical protein BN7_3542 [Wickerhamomyces ciferrii]|uniref:Uncharacterized protein n=1 Tax=Wickerhamomyces ciferrii (strain ATCC 14091 / BCRC 22168 / CBS 111 / JCM 3599 / NBRC 0793 / NRRL Y-1031 F-60-10) TaxID=1206466 RepID=K0KRM4_WICCF|nr:uncharacterized protein BN7_3542 [Wickerhamomyces ciferrii]CCH43988.1 hypothetical protein BN7_3542 [Wickerhamomyces ciferrii]
MSYPYPNQSMDQLANGVQNLNIEQQQAQQPVAAAPGATAGRKKRPARAYHDLNQNNAAQAQFQSPVPPQQFGLQQPFQTPVDSTQTFNPAASQVGGTPNSFTPGIPVAGAPITPGFGDPSAPTQPSYNSVQPENSGDSLSVPYQRKIQENEYAFTPFKTFENTVPPTATTKFTAVDQGTASPRFMRLSMYNVPSSEALRNSTKLPLGLTVRPFAPSEYNEEPVPEVDLTQIEGPPRCRRCRTYVNPGMAFTHDNKMVCNMCKFPTPLPYEYQSPLDVSGRRMDAPLRPELHKGTVDFIVPNSYWEEEGVQPNTLHHVFLIDVSAPNEVIKSTTESVRSTLQSIPAGVKVGIITYDERIQFYNLQSEQCSVHIASDLEDPFVPINEGLFVDPQENIFQIEDALNKIEEIYAEFKSAYVAYGAALKYALYALGTVGGGKITATLTKIPGKGPGTLLNPNNKDSSPEVFKTSNDYYNKLADEFVQKNVSLDLFVISKSAVDLINSGIITSKTGGVLKLYSNFVQERDEFLFNEEFKKAVSSTQGYQGQLKIRCSGGLQVAKYYGNFDSKASVDPKIPVVGSEQQFSALFQYDDELNEKEDAHFQAALLYTGIDGRRRVRVVNMVAAVTKDVKDVFAFVDQDVVLDIIIKDCLSYFSKQHATEIKVSSTHKLVEVFTQYRGLVVKNNALPTQLIFPDSLKTIISYINSFQKSKIFRVSIPNNSKIYDYYQLNSLTLDKLLLKLYPRVIPLHSLAEDDCIYDETTGFFNLPINSKASLQNLDYGGAYFIFNGEKLYLWIHNAVNELLVKDLLGVEDLKALSPLTNELPELNTHVSLQARNLINFYKTQLGYNTLTYQLCRVGIDGSEFEIADLLVEDKTLDKTQSYTEFLTNVHKQIKDQIEQDKVIKSKEVSLEDVNLAQRYLNI